MRLKSRVLRYEVEQHLVKGWTPELISGRFRQFRPEPPSVNTESISQWIYAEARHLIGYLPRSRKERFPRGKGRKTRRTMITDRAPLDLRSPEANARKEPGHWESDLMVGRGRAALQNTVERTSRLVRLPRVVNKSAKESRRA